MLPKMGALVRKGGRLIRRDKKTGRLIMSQATGAHVICAKRFKKPSETQKPKVKARRRRCHTHDGGGVSVPFPFTEENLTNLQPS